MKKNVLKILILAACLALGTTACAAWRVPQQYGGPSYRGPMYPYTKQGQVWSGLAHFRGPVIWAPLRPSYPPHGWVLVHSKHGYWYWRRHFFRYWW